VFARSQVSRHALRELAFAVVVYASVVLWLFPVDLSGWYMASSLCALLSVLALAAFAFHTTLAGRPSSRMIFSPEFARPISRDSDTRFTNRTRAVFLDQMQTAAI